MKKRNIFFNYIMIIILGSTLLLATSLEVASQTPVAANGKLRVSGTNLVNEKGTAIQLRGMSTHGPQWFKQCYNSSSLNVLVNDWGIDVFRIAMYVGEGGYLNNPSYWRSWIDDMVELCGQQGIYCLIDWHVLKPGNPNANLNEAKEFWDYMSKKHKGKDHVLYEICNEPNGVNWSTIKSYANQIIPIIRANDPNTIVIVGTPTWSQDVDIASSDKLNYSNIMYALHFYAGTHKQYLRDKASRAIANGAALFVTEFGTSQASGDGGPYLSETQTWIDFLAANKISWVNWSFADKSEVSAALNPGSCRSNYNNTSRSGTFIKQRILNPPDDWVGEEVPVTGVTVLPNAASLSVGDTTQLTASVEPSNATNKTVSWESNNTAVATVSSTGLVTGVSSGPATVTVTTEDGGFTATSKITVKTVNTPVSGVKVVPTSVSVNVGGTAQLNATVSPSNATNKNVSWSSSNTSVATVSSTGLVTGVSNGTATVTVTTEDGGFTASSKITVTTANIPVTGVTVAPASASIDVGNKIQLNATVSPSNATNKAVSWNSGNTAVATVSPTGEVTGVKAGNATITVTTEDGGFTASSKITVTGGGNSDCDSPVTISIPFKHDGAGDFCWVTTTEMDYVNSWNLEELTINGEDFTNVWSSSLPPAQNGQWVIHYVGKYGWSHFEAPAAKNARPMASGAEQEITIFPNPFKEGFYIDLNGTSGINRIEVVNPLGQVVETIDEGSIQEDLTYLKTGTGPGLYFILIYDGENPVTKMIIKE